MKASAIALCSYSIRIFVARHTWTVCNIYHFKSMPERSRAVVSGYIFVNPGLWPVARAQYIRGRKRRVTRHSSICDIASQIGFSRILRCKYSRSVLLEVSTLLFPTHYPLTTHIVFAMRSLLVPLLLVQSVLAAPAERAAAAATVGKIRGVRDPIYHLYLQANSKNSTPPSLE
jgi:hypothetical protein